VNNTTPVKPVAFDAFATDYDNLWTARLYDDSIVSQLPPNPNFVLDLGCGTGSLTEKLGAKAKHVLGIDISSKAIEIARNKVSASNIEFKIMLIEDIVKVVKPGSCDAIIAARSLHHCESLPDLIPTLVSLLSPHGKFIIHELHGTGIYAGNKLYRRYINIAYQLNILFYGLRQHCFSTAFYELRQEKYLFSTDAWQNHKQSEPAFNCNALISLMKASALFTTSINKNKKFRLLVGDKRILC
jgi:ubiquinone/menaquinone biosynthesis C-methylase UbiE